MNDARLPADPLDPEFRLEHWPFWHMNMAIRAYDLDMKHLLRSSHLDLPRWRILMIVNERAPVSVSEAASSAIMEMSTVTRAMQRLQRDGLLDMRTRTSDQRVSEALLTAQGRELTERVMRAASRCFIQAFRGFEPFEISMLNALLTRIHRNLRDPL